MSSKKPPKTRRQKIAIPKPAADHLTVEQRQAIQAMASQGLPKSTIAAALQIEGDLLQLEAMPEMRVGRVANVLFSDIEERVGLKEGRRFPSVRGLSKKHAVIAAYKECAS